MTQIHTLQSLISMPKASARKEKAAAAQKPRLAGEIAPEKPLPKLSPALQRLYFGGLKDWQKSLVDDATKIASTAINQTQFRRETEIISFNDYLEKVFEQPQIACDSYQRIFDMISAKGKVDTGKVDKSGDKIYAYNFFTDPANAENAIAGMDYPLHEFMKSIESAAKGGDIRSRFFMFEGPVGTAKSTIMTLLKRGEEEWTRNDQGALYALTWDDIPEEVAKSKDLQLNQHPKTGRYFYEEPMHDDPLRVIPEKARKELLGKLNENFARINGGKAPYRIDLKGGLSPASDLIRQKLLEFYSDPAHPDRVPQNETPMSMVLKHAKAKRMVLDETRRTGIASYMPKDPKNQDSTELNGDIDYSKLPMYGDPNHPLVQAYKGEFCVSNRGIMEFIEILKLQREFLYDMLTAAQERLIKPKNGTMIPLDAVIIGHTNMEELVDKMKDGKMKAFFNRAVRIRVPYLLDAATEKKIYEKGFVKRAQEQGLHIAPHALDVAAQWAIETRKDKDITAEAESLSNINDGQGLYGTSPRFLQSVFSRALVHSAVQESGVVTPFTLIRIIRKQLEDGGILDAKNLPKYLDLLDRVKVQLTEKIKDDVSNAIMMDEELLKKYFMRYLQNLALWNNPEKAAGANDQFMKRVERAMKAPVNDQDVRPYRLDLLQRLNALDNGPIVVATEILEQDDNLRKALAQVMFEDLKYHRENIPESEVVEAMVKKLGYSPASAREAIEHLLTPNGIV